MKTLQFTFDLNRLRISETERKDFDHGGVFSSYFKAGLEKKHPGGLAISRQKILNRILEKLHQASNSREEESVKFVDLEEAEFDLVKEAFSEDLAWPVHLNAAIVQVYDNLEKASCKDT